MQIEIFELLPTPEGWKLDLERRVAVIDVGEGKGSFRFDDPSRERLLRRVFEDDFRSFAAPEQAAEGYPDCLISRKAWEPETLRYILQRGLYGHSLGGRVVQP